jgi:Guanine nucleotide exchange factor synembryn
MRSPALTELLKFLYNLSFHIKLHDEAGLMYSTCPTYTNVRLAKPLIQFILATSPEEFSSPYTNVIHCCLNLNLEPSKSQLFPEDSSADLIQKLVGILDKQIPEDTESIHDSVLDENLSPVVTFVNNLHEIFPDQLKSYLKTTVLPSES